MGSEILLKLGNEIVFIGFFLGVVIGFYLVMYKGFILVIMFDVIFVRNVD